MTLNGNWRPLLSGETLETLIETIHTNSHLQGSEPHHRYHFFMHNVHVENMHVCFFVCLINTHHKGRIC